MTRHSNLLVFEKVWQETLMGGNKVWIRGTIVFILLWKERNLTGMTEFFQQTIGSC